MINYHIGKHIAYTEINCVTVAMMNVIVPKSNLIVASANTLLI